MEELEKMSLVELRLYGRKLGMKNATTFKKKELIGDSKNSGIRGGTGSRENCEKFCKRFKREEIRYDRGEKNSKDNGKAGRKKNRETSGKKE